MPNPNPVINSTQLSSFIQLSKCLCMKNLRRFLFCCLVLFCAFSQKSNAQCDFTEANLVGGPASFTVPAGQVLCINSNFCMGAASNFPGACANSAVNSLIINGTMRIASGVTFRFAGSINGTGNIQILQGGRINLFGSVNCAGGLAISAVDMSHYYRHLHIYGSY